MKEGDKGLVKKFFWAQKVDNIGEFNPTIAKIIEKSLQLEKEGFGMLADKDNPEIIDLSDKGPVVCPDGTIVTEKEINFYWESRYKNDGSIYNSGNTEDVKMHKARIYYCGFKETRKKGNFSH